MLSWGSTHWTPGPATPDGGTAATLAASNSDIVGVDDYYHQKITAVEALYLIKSAVA